MGRVALKHPQPLSAMFGQSDDMFESISVVPDGDALAADARFLLLNQTAGAHMQLVPQSCNFPTLHSVCKIEEGD